MFSLICFKTGSQMICQIDTAFKLDITVVIATSGIAIVGTTAKMTESIVIEMKILRGVTISLGTGLIFPFGGSKLGAGRGSFFSFPSFSCGYQNRACFDIL